MALGTPSGAVTSYSTGSVSTMVITLPTHSEGDLLVVHMALDDVVATEFTNPSGWSTLMPFTQGPQVSTKVIYKFAGASEPSTITVPIVGDTERFVAVAYAVSGADTPETPGVYIHTSDTFTYACPSVTPSGSDNLLITGAFNDALTVPFSQASSTKIEEVQYTSAGSICAFYRVWDSTSPTGTHNITTSSSRTGVAVSFIIPAASTGDNLTSAGIKTTPTVGAPTVTEIEVDALTAVGLDWNMYPYWWPALIGQYHTFSTSGLKVEPELGTGIFKEGHTLLGSSLETVPETKAATLGQTQELSGSNLESGPTISTSYLTQEHLLDADSTQSEPQLATPSVGSTHLLSGEGLYTTPDVAVSTPGQTHDLSSVYLSSEPNVGAPSPAQTHGLTAETVFETPEIDAPTLLQDHILSGSDLVVSPTAASSNLGQDHVLSPQSAKTSPTVTTPLLAYGDLLVGQGLVVSIATSASALSQTHICSAQGLLAQVETGSPNLGLLHQLDGLSIKLEPYTESAALEQAHALAPDGVDTIPAVTSTTLFQEHILGAYTVSVQSEIETTELRELHAFVAVGCNTEPQIDQPDLLSVHILDSESLLVEALVGRPSIVTIATGLASVLIDSCCPDVELSSTLVTVTASSTVLSIDILNSEV